MASMYVNLTRCSYYFEVTRNPYFQVDYKLKYSVGIPNTYSFLKPEQNTTAFVFKSYIFHPDQIRPSCGQKLLRHFFRNLSDTRYHVEICWNIDVQSKFDNMFVSLPQIDHYIHM
jgi:hypothetical protein